MLLNISALLARITCAGPEDGAARRGGLLWLLLAAAGVFLLGVSGHLALAGGAAVAVALFGFRRGGRRGDGP